jgi:hypothetical protein
MQLKRQSTTVKPSQLTQGKMYFWDITMHCTGSHNSWKKRKAKLEKGESQSVRQAKHTM